MASYRPMTIADLALHLIQATDDRTRWKLVWEFLEEYRWEPAVSSRPCFETSLLLLVTSAGTPSGGPGRAPRGAA